MPDPFDPYREALVVEHLTLWTAEAREASDAWAAADRQRFEQRLHREPSAAACLDYTRVHTGFCRQITVQPEDIERLRPAIEKEQHG